MEFETLPGGMAEVATEISELEWKKIGIGAVLRAVFLVTAVLVMGFGMTYAGRALGWPDSMIRIGANVGIAAVTLPFLIQAVKPVIRLYRPEEESGEETKGHTVDEITIKTTSVRRRHYLKQIGKTIFGVVMSLGGAFNVYALVTMRPELYPEWQEIFGKSASLNYRFMIGMMAFMCLVGIVIAARSWLNRFQDEEESIIDTMRELEE